MNPQLEIHLQDFGLLDNDQQQTQNSNHENDNSRIRQDSDVIGGENVTHTIALHHPIRKKDENPSVDDGGINGYLKFWILLLVVAIAEWQELFTLRLEAQITVVGSDKRIPVPRTFFGCLLVIVAVYFIWICFMDHLDGSASTDRTLQKHLQQRRTCRLEISKRLGSIGAPFLQQWPLNDDDAFGASKVRDDSGHLGRGLNAVRQLPPVMTSARFFLLLVDYADAHVKLIQTMDTALVIIKSGTALHLGATVSTAERVERAIFGRETTRGQTSKNVSSACVSFATMRVLVAQAMVRQAETLESILRETSQNTGSNDDATRNVSGFAGVDRVPSVVTISWLRSSRLELADLLSHALDELFSVTKIGLYDDRKMEQIKETIQKSTLIAKEMTPHIQSLWGSTHKVVHKDGTTTCRPPSVNQYLLQVQAQIRNLCIAILDLGDLGVEDPNNCCKDHWRCVHQWNEAVQTSLQELDRIFCQDQGDHTADENEGSLQETTLTLLKTPRELGYTIEAQAQRDRPNHNVRKPTKTAIFSAKGALEPPEPQNSQSRKQGAKSNGQRSLSISTLRPDPVAQHVLLGELQTRLRSLSLPEEEHEIADDDDSDETGDQINEQTSSVSMFRGASGSMVVSELNDAIKLLRDQRQSDGEGFEDEIT